MEIIQSTKWISEWEMEDAPNFMDEFEMNPFDFSLEEFKFEQTGRTDFHGLLTAVDSGEKRQRLLAPPKADSSSSSSHIISFEKCMEPKIEMANYESDGNLKLSRLINNNNKYNSRVCYGEGIKKGGGSMNNRSNPLHAREHVIAERKRREKLSQRFIALSALIPGLNKIDKASILSGAIRYVKELQDHLKMVEEKAAIKSKMLEEEQSAVYVKRKTLVSSDDGSGDTSSSDENNSFSNRPIPEIEARISNKDVLIRIHCNKYKGCLSYLLNKIENLNLTILNNSALPFGHSKLDITIVAQVDVGFCMTMENVVKNLRQALLDFN